MGDAEPLNNTLHKDKHRRNRNRNRKSSRVGLDPVVAFCLVGCIERTHNIPGEILSNYITHRKKQPLNKTLETSLEANRYQLP